MWMEDKQFDIALSPTLYKMWMGDKVMRQTPFSYATQNMDGDKIIGQSPFSGTLLSKRPLTSNLPRAPHWREPGPD